jgi:hypothetical protein
VGYFPGVVRVVRDHDTVVLTIRPLDDGVGESWEVALDHGALGGLALGEAVVRPVRVDRAKPAERCSPAPPEEP